MELAISTPAILFSTISLMMIAFTNRYLAIASLIRELHDKFRQNPEASYVQQIKHLHRRVHIIRNIQFIIVTSLLLSAVSMLFVYLQNQTVGQLLFFVALLFQIVALMMSIWEISISIHALKIELSDMEDELGHRFSLFGRSKSDD
ncbi:MAG: DUF2721 domain-containing protein [Spirosomataceae bacterium]